MKNLITSATFFLALSSFAQSNELVSFQIQTNEKVTSFEAVGYQSSNSIKTGVGNVESIIGSQISLQLSPKVDYEFIVNRQELIEIKGSDIAQYAIKMEDERLAKALEVPGLLFTVQVGAFNRTRPNSIIANYDDVKTEQIEGTSMVRYMVGSFQSAEEAKNAINEYQAAGFKDAFPVAYFNGERISLTEACCQEVMAAK